MHRDGDLTIFGLTARDIENPSDEILKNLTSVQCNVVKFFLEGAFLF